MHTVAEENGREVVNSTRRTALKCKMVLEIVGKLENLLLIGLDLKLGFFWVMALKF